MHLGSIYTFTDKYGCVRMCTEETEKTEFSTDRGEDELRNIPYLSVLIRKIRMPMYYNTVRRSGFQGAKTKKKKK